MVIDYIGSSFLCSSWALNLSLGLTHKTSIPLVNGSKSLHSPSHLPLPFPFLQFSPSPPFLSSLFSPVSVPSPLTVARGHGEAFSSKLSHLAKLQLLWFWQHFTSIKLTRTRGWSLTFVVAVHGKMSQSALITKPCAVHRLVYNKVWYTTIRLQDTSTFNSTHIQF